MNYVITTTIKGVPHGINTDAKKKKFVLHPLNSVSDVHKVMNFPQLSLARSILNWILKNDRKLSKHDFNISPSAQYG